MDRTERRLGRDWVFASASILAKCKTAPALVLVLAMLKVDCKSLIGMRLADGRGNTRGRGRYGLEEGDSGGKGSAAIAGAGCGRRHFTDWAVRVFGIRGLPIGCKFHRPAD
jgi:hypothetical protein